MNSSTMLERPSWLEDSHIRERCDGTNSSTEDAVARCAATHKETEYTGDTYRSIPSNTSLSGILSPFPITSPEFQGGKCGPSRVSCARTRFCALAGNPCVFMLSITLVVLKVDEASSMAQSGLISCVRQRSLGCHIVELSQFPSASKFFRRTFYFFACAWCPHIQQSAQARGVFAHTLPTVGLRMRRQVASQFECTCGGPRLSSEQNLGVFQCLLHTLFTTKSEFLIAFKDHHLRASLFIKLSLDTFVVTLHRMTSPMSAAAWWSSVLGFVRSSVTLLPGKFS